MTRSEKDVKTYHAEPHIELHKNVVMVTFGSDYGWTWEWLFQMVACGCLSKRLKGFYWHPSFTFHRWQRIKRQFSQILEEKTITAVWNASNATEGQVWLTIRTYPRWQTWLAHADATREFQTQHHSLTMCLMCLPCGYWCRPSVWGIVVGQSSSFLCKKPMWLQVMYGWIFHPRDTKMAT